MSCNLSNKGVCYYAFSMSGTADSERSIGSDILPTAAHTKSPTDTHPNQHTNPPAQQSSLNVYRNQRHRPHAIFRRIACGRLHMRMSAAGQRL